MSEAAASSTYFQCGSVGRTLADSTGNVYHFLGSQWTCLTHTIQLVYLGRVLLSYLLTLIDSTSLNSSIAYQTLPLSRPAECLEAIRVSFSVITSFLEKFLMSRLYCSDYKLKLCPVMNTRYKLKWLLESNGNLPVPALERGLQAFTSRAASCLAIPTGHQAFHFISLHSPLPIFCQVNVIYNPGVSATKSLAVFIPFVSTSRVPGLNITV